MASHVTWAIEYSNSPVKGYRAAMAAPAGWLTPTQRRERFGYNPAQIRRPFAAADSKLPPKRKDPEMAALKGLFTTDQPRRRAIQRREALVATILNSMAVPLRRQTNVVDTTSQEPLDAIARNLPARREKLTMAAPMGPLTAVGKRWALVVTALNQ